MTVTLASLRNFTEQDKNSLFDRVDRHLRSLINEGWHLIVAEKKTANELKVSGAVVADVSSRKLSRDFYLQRKKR